MEIAWNDSKGDITGTIKYIDKYGDPYPVNEQSGHFFPVKFEDACYNKVITIGSQNGVGGKYITPTAEDPYLVIRVENVTVANKISAILQSTGEEIFELDFTDATCLDCPVGEVAFNADKEDYGRFGNTDAFYENVTIEWNKTNATVKGKLKYVKKDGESKFEKLPEDGNYFAFSLADWFKEKEITVVANSENKVKDTDCVVRVRDKNKNIVVKYEDTVIATFDLSEVELATE